MQAARPRLRGDRGFSLVELLVTITLAAVVLAAMVPLFVNAQQASAADKVRSTALNLAQDRVEKIRQLSFDEACDASAIASALGTSWTSYGENGGRTFAISYASTPGGGTTPTYTKVEVTVSWTAPPSPVKPVELTTIVADNEVATVASSPTPSSSASTSASPSASASASPSPSASVTTYPNKKYTLTCATNEWYGHKVHLYQTNVTPVVDEGTQEFNGNVSAEWKNIPSGAYRVEHTFGWWNYVTEVSTVYLTSDLTLRYDSYKTLYPGH